MTTGCGFTNHDSACLSVFLRPQDISASCYVTGNFICVGRRFSEEQRCSKRPSLICSKWTESGALQRESSFFIFLCFVFVDFRLRTYPSFVFVFVFLDCGCVCIQHFLDLQTVSLRGHSSLTRLDLPLFSSAAEISDVQRFLFSFFSSFFFFRQQNNQKMWSSPLPVISQTKRSLIWGRVCLMQS